MHNILKKIQHLFSVNQSIDQTLFARHDREQDACVKQLTQLRISSLTWSPVLGLYYCRWTLFAAAPLWAGLDWSGTICLQN